MAQALAYLHHYKIVHLDIKSQNVLLTRSGLTMSMLAAVLVRLCCWQEFNRPEYCHPGRDGSAKVADVGLAQVAHDTYLTQVNSLGTFAYAAPELLAGDRCTTKADLWSFGVLIWELVTREPPQRGKLRDVRYRHSLQSVVL